MSVQRQTDIKCDECGAWYDDPHRIAAEVRAEARLDGWLTNLPGGRDVCSDCRLRAKYLD